MSRTDRFASLAHNIVVMVVIKVDWQSQDEIGNWMKFAFRFICPIKKLRHNVLNRTAAACRSRQPNKVGNQHLPYSDTRCRCTVFWTDIVESVFDYTE